jgi:hypothetical protein
MFKRNLPGNSPWRRYQTAQWLIALTNLTFVGVAVLIAELAPELYDSGVNLAIMACVVAIPNLAAGYWLRNFSCPRCHQPFFWTLSSGLAHIDKSMGNSDSREISRKSGVLAVGTDRGLAEINLRQDTQLARACRNCGLRIWRDP